MRQVLSLQEPLSDLSPVVLNSKLITGLLAGRAADYAGIIRTAYDRVSQSKDVVIMEGAAGVIEGAILGLSVYDIIQMLHPQVLLVVRYSDDLSIEIPFMIRSIIGDALIGVLFNAVPRGKLEWFQNEVVPYVQKQGIRVFGTLPLERLLLSISVAEVAEVLDGDILNNPEQGDELVENLMVGAMSLDSALDYFRRKPNKVVFTGGDRPDIQLAALQTSTRCIVLTGGISPSPLILAQAEDLGVPLIQTQDDTLTAVERVERIFGKSRFHQEKKVIKFQQLLEQHFDFTALYGQLAL
jgi:BioD-like phosphotransacetylase family protein